MTYDRFSKKAGAYDKYRPKYSQKFIEYLYNFYKMSKDSVVADIGAGTGILSEEFLLRDTGVICVEPNKEMLEFAKKRLSKYNNVSFINSTAENTTIQDQSVDFVTVGQAFHWFDKKKFLEECKRILVSDGIVSLAWNVSNSSDIVSRQIFELNSRILTNYNGYNSRDKDTNDEYYDFFLNGQFDCQNFNNDLLLNREDFIGRCISRSYSPNVGDDNYIEYIDGLNEIFEANSEKGKIKILNTTKAVIGKVK